MQLKIKNIGGCKSADFTIDKNKPVLIRGLNESGKTSILRALLVLLTRNPNPEKLTGPRKRDYVTFGARDAEAVLIGPNWSLKWDGKEAVEESGPVPAPLPQVLLDHSYLKMKGIEAVTAWERILHAEVAREVLRKRLDALLQPYFRFYDKIADELAGMAMTGNAGWKQAVGTAEYNMRTAKNKWEAAVAKAGEKGTWGSAKGATWKPQLWTVECDGLTEAAAMAEVTQRTAVLEGERKKSFVSETEARRRDELVSKIEELEELKERLRPELIELEKKVNAERLEWDSDRLQAKARERWVEARTTPPSPS